ITLLRTVTKATYIPGFQSAVSIKSQVGLTVSILLPSISNTSIFPIGFLHRKFTRSVKGLGYTSTELSSGASGITLLVLSGKYTILPVHIEIGILSTNAF